MAVVRRSEQECLGHLLRDQCSHHHRVGMALGLLGRPLGLLGLDAPGPAATSRNRTRLAVGRAALGRAVHTASSSPCDRRPMAIANMYRTHRQAVFLQDAGNT